MKPANKPSLINCHAHIFIGESIPPYLAKTFLPPPLYYLFNTKLVLSICRWWFLGMYSPRQLKKYARFKKILGSIVAYRSFIKRHTLTNLIVQVINLILVYHALAYITLWLVNFFIKPDEKTQNILLEAINWLTEKRLFYYTAGTSIKIIAVLFTIICIGYGRKFIFFLLKKLWGFLSILPNKKTIEFLGRYINIGRFAYYKNQADLFDKLKKQYPDKTGFIILPMDMEFMEAGKIANGGDYETQMAQLDKLKNNSENIGLFFPFVFVDPRRQMAGAAPFLKWEADDNRNVILKGCFIKEYIEQKQFNGFKIYPALGYYPFDEALLPLWKYAADNKIPVLTHAIRGTIYYRGSKKKEWNHHPVFQQADGNGTLSPLLLPQIKNIEFINNFTHPLNFLCLVEERLLRIVVGSCSKKVQDLFGYAGEEEPLRHNLSNLKLCFGHFGGDDEWAKYLESDRDNFSSQLVTKPKGIDLIKPGEQIDVTMRRLELVWNSVDWYSIICSMMLQYPNLYADISYIVHNNSILPLLKRTLQHPGLSSKVLYGTDFYVVRNHKSEKEMLAEMLAGLSDQEFDLIARQNPYDFL